MKARRVLISLLVIGCALSASIFAFRISDKNRTIDKLYAAGGDVQTWSDPPSWVSRVLGQEMARRLFSSPTRINFIEESGRPHKLNDDLLCEVLRFPKLRYLFLYECELSGAGFECMSSSSRIEELAFINCPIEDEFIPFLTRAKRLRVLDLCGTNITSESVKYLAQIRSLKEFYAWDSFLDEDDVEYLQARNPHWRILTAPVGNPEGTHRPSR